MNIVKQNMYYFIITIGCQMNKSDSERLALYLDENGLREAKNRTKADLVVLTTCGVRESAESRIYGLIPRIRKENPDVKIVLTGCLSERDDIKKRVKSKVDLWMPIGSFHALDRFINKGGVKTAKVNNYLSYLAKHSSEFSAFVPIGNGCDNYCAYCVVPYARGREVYRPADEIIKEVRELVKKGYREINLIAQNVNSFADDRRQTTDDRTRINFADLLRMMNDIPGKFWIRFATSHPKDMSDELIKTVAECDKICEHIHLPIQAGDDTVLRRMNRGYTAEHYKDLITKIRATYKSQIPNPKSQTPENRFAVTGQVNSKSQILSQKLISRGLKNTKLDVLPVAISTDIIVGFPGETRGQFNNTVKLFKELRFDMAYIAQYSSRPGTAAAKMKDDVNKEEKKRRDVVLTEVLKKTALENNKKYIGKIVEVLIKGRNRKNKWMGETRTGKNVEIRDQGSGIRDQEGEFAVVKIIEVKDFGMVGEVRSNK